MTTERADAVVPAEAVAGRFFYTDPSYARLWERFWTDRDEITRNDLLLAYEPLILVVIGQLPGSVRTYWDRDDLASFGILGLVAAIDRFDPSSPVNRFACYAALCIRGAIYDELRRLDWLPRSVRKRVTEYQATADELCLRLGREPGSSEVLDTMGVAGAARQAVLSGVQSSQMLHLDRVVEVEGSDGAIRLADVLPAEDGADPQAVVVESEQVATLRRALDDLPERQRRVITLHLFEGFTLEQIGVQLGVSASRVCQIEAAALRSLRELLGHFADEILPAGTG
ncbi:MAG TPA: sigma-70 family RNA polymerase sigma factor [Acidimicrobiales bacterium]|nr:sigma-70 family RNA polymerase sigma factor [Acidimicrobiales bacterium]